MLTFFRRSPLFWGTILASAASILLLLGRDTSWIGIWPRGSAAAQRCSFYLAAMISAAQAILAGRDRRAAMTAQEFPTPRSALNRAAVGVGMGCVAALVTYGIPFLVVLVENLRNGSPTGGIWWSYVILGLPVMATGVAVGHVTGTLVRSDHLAPVLSAALTFVVISTAGQVTHLVAMSGDAWFDLARPALLARVALGITMLVMAVAVAAFTETSRSPWKSAAKRSTVSGGVCAVALAAAVCATLATPDVQVPRRPPEKPLCRGAHPQVCLWPDDAAYLAQVQQMQRGMQHLPKRFVVPEKFVETGLSRPRGAGELPTGNGRLWNAANGMAMRIGLASYPSTCIPDGAEAQQKFSTANFNILAFLLRSIHGSGAPADEGGGPPADADTIERVVTSSDAAKNDWLDGQEKDLHAPPCTQG